MPGCDIHQIIDNIRNARFISVAGAVEVCDAYEALERENVSLREQCETVQSSYQRAVDEQDRLRERAEAAENLAETRLLRVQTLSRALNDIHHRFDVVKEERDKQLAQRRDFTPLIDTLKYYSIDWRFGADAHIDGKIARDTLERWSRGEQPEKAETCGEGGCDLPARGMPHSHPAPPAPNVEELRARQRLIDLWVTEPVIDALLALMDARIAMKGVTP